MVQPKSSIQQSNARWRRGVKLMLPLFIFGGLEPTMAADSWQSDYVQLIWFDIPGLDVGAGTVCCYQQNGCVVTLVHQVDPKIGRLPCCRRLHLLSGVLALPSRPVGVVDHPIAKVSNWPSRSRLTRDRRSFVWRW